MFSPESLAFNWQFSIPAQLRHGLPLESVWRPFFCLGIGCGLRFFSERLRSMQQQLVRLHPLSESQLGTPWKGSWAQFWSIILRTVEGSSGNKAIRLSLCFWLLCSVPP